MAPFTIDLIQNLGLPILQVINQYDFRGAMYLGIAILNVFSHFVAFDLWSSRRRYFNRCGNVYRKWLNNELVLCGESRPGYIEIQEENRAYCATCP